MEDLRPQVRYEGEPAAWVGEQRDGFGIPFNVGTRDGRALATIVEETIARDLEALGFDVVRAGEGSDIVGALAAAGAERALVVTMHEFNSNTFFNTDVEWDLEAAVHGADGGVLQRGREHGHQTISGSSAGRRNERKVPDFFYRTLRALVVEDPDLVAALAR